MANKNVKDFLPQQSINLNSDSILAVSNNELKRLNGNNASLTINNVYATNIIYNTGNQTINGVKTFNDNIIMGSNGIISGLNQFDSLAQDIVTTSLSQLNAFTFNLQGGKLYRCESFFRFTPGGSNSASDVNKNPANSVWADGYRMGVNNNTTFLPLNSIFVSDITNAAGGFWGSITGTNTHIRKAILRPLQNSTITFTYYSNNGLSTTFDANSYVLIEKIA